MNCCTKASAPKAPPAASDKARLAIEKANRCLRLARVILDMDTVRLLQEMAADYLREAERLSRED
ncbi:MAG TPA: hypothetical protein VJO12_14560 [Stellaceae bacterium]|nr:hypothetical protein [Stellaceae bacterium]